MSKLIAAVLLSLSLSGCATRGYVESDVPGVAAWLAKPIIDRNIEQTCSNYKAGYGSYTEATTSLSLTRARVEYSFQCE
jgi:hypothetical protein